MELKQLRYFVALAEELHFQRAAKKLHITQPSLSYQIKAIETELDVTLVIRDRKSVSLSKPGKILLEQAKKVLASYDEAINATVLAGGQMPEHIRLGMIAYINLAVVTQSIVATHAQSSHGTVEFVDTTGQDAFDLVKEGELDIGFALLPVHHDALKVKPVVEGHWGIVLPINHPWAEQGEVAIEELDGQPLIMFDRQANLNVFNTCMGYFEAAGAKPHIVFETKQVQTGISMASAGSGYYFVASFIVEDLPPDLVWIKLTGFDNHMRIGAAWREDNKSKLLQVYLEQLRNLLGQSNNHTH